MVSGDITVPAPCSLVMHNMETPTRCVCSRDAEPRWVRIAACGSPDPEEGS